MRIPKNVLQLLYIIAHEIIIFNSVSEYTNGPWKFNDACGLVMSCISEHESAKNMSGFIIGMNRNFHFYHFTWKSPYATTGDSGCICDIKTDFTISK